VEAIGSAAEVELLRDRDKVAQVSKFHRRSRVKLLAADKGYKLRDGSRRSYTQAV
jgi:hypothetical protein